LAFKERAAEINLSEAVRSGEAMKSGVNHKMSAQCKPRRVIDGRGGGGPAEKSRGVTRASEIGEN
jgi:hypothetical protein